MNRNLWHGHIFDRHVSGIQYHKHCIFFWTQLLKPIFFCVYLDNCLSSVLVLVYDEDLTQSKRQNINLKPFRIIDLCMCFFSQTTRVADTSTTTRFTMASTGIGVAMLIPMAMGVLGRNTTADNTITCNDTSLLFQSSREETETITI